MNFELNKIAAITFDGDMDIIFENGEGVNIAVKDFTIRKLEQIEPEESSKHTVTR